MSEKTYVPASLETVFRSTPVSELRRTTDALVTTAPVESRTTPFSEAVESWARAEVVDKAKTLIIHSRLRKCDHCTRESVISPPTVPKIKKNDLAPRFSKRRHSSMKVLELVKNYLSARKGGFALKKA